MSSRLGQDAIWEMTRLLAESGLSTRNSAHLAALGGCRYRGRVVGFPGRGPREQAGRKGRHRGAGVTTVLARTIFTMKKRLAKMGADSSSPDDGDALALTFAMPVAPRKPPTPASSKPKHSPWN